MYALLLTVDRASAELPRAPQEEGFKARVEESRQAELKELFKFTMLKSMFGVVWEGMGYVTMMVAFSAYSYTGQALTADVAFPALALFDILRMPMIMMVPQRHLAHSFSAVFRPFCAALSPFFRRCPASWRRDGENGRKMAENGRNLGEKRARNSGG